MSAGPPFAGTTPATAGTPAVAPAVPGRPGPAGRIGRLTVIGVPGHRRTAGVTAAALAAGLSGPDLVAWREVLAPGAPDRVFAPGPVRVDSPGEDPAVHALLGGGRAPADPQRVEGGAVRYAALRGALARVEAWLAASPGAWPTSDPGDIAVMFDKRLTHARLAAAGVPVPAAPPSSPGGYAELREAMRAAGMRRVFVKPAHGSSASGVVALETAPGRVRATTSAEMVRAAGSVRLYNSLRIRVYDREADVAALVDALAPDGLHVEEWVPKLTLGGLRTDLRVLVVAGRATHVVARASRSPMTNLHLGNARADLAAVRAALGEAAWARAMATCVRAARCFPRTLHVGVDLLVRVDGRRFAVGEVNAFGDLLPGVLHEGRDTWAEQVRALVSGWRPCAGAGAAGDGGGPAGVRPGPGDVARRGVR